MAELFRYHHRVTYADCTIGDHIYHSRYLDLLEANEAVIARNVSENLYRRHIAPVFLGRNL